MSSAPAIALGAESVARFHREGYLVVERFLDPDRVAALMAETDSVIADPPPLRVRDAFELGYWTQWGVYSYHVGGLETRGPTLAALQVDERSRAIAAELAGCAVRPTGLSMQAMYAHCGCRQPWHQDHTPGDPRLWWINCVYYLADMHEDNGSLLVIPGSQHAPLDRRMTDYGLVPGAVRVRCPAGSAVFFTNGLLHAVDENRSAWLRRNLKVNHVPDGCDFWIQHEQRYSRGIRRGIGPVAATPNPTTSHWFA
ncbi:MAG TPA: phytanoyl-CoA dioxygenase family protein [Planctomycetota bacterium]|nr:phytanoyl-CoA dioxygenase family protein [Planctomycetota bacterium]